MLVDIAKRFCRVQGWNQTTTTLLSRPIEQGAIVDGGFGADLYLKQAVICALLLVFVSLAAWKMRRRTVCGLEVHGYSLSHTSIEL